MARQPKSGARHRLKQPAGTVRRNPAVLGEDCPITHMDSKHAIKRVVLDKSNATVNTLCVQLDDGSWIAVELRPDNSGVGRTKAEAEESVRRRTGSPASDTEDALDLAAIERHRHENMIPLERLVTKYRL
jgi:hypothetical protein